MIKKQEKITAKPRLKFIDRLEIELKRAGIVIKRGGMDDYGFDKTGKRSDTMDDHCEWVTIVLKTEDQSKKYEVEFFFTDDSKKLETVMLYVKKKKRGYGSAKLIGVDRPKKIIENKTDQRPAVSTPTTIGVC